MNRSDKKRTFKKAFQPKNLMVEIIEDYVADYRLKNNPKRIKVLKGTKLFVCKHGLDYMVSQGWAKPYKGDCSELHMEIIF